MEAARVEGVAKHYSLGLGKPRKHALRGVNLQVRAGSAFGLIGPNGAGKTTLLKILLALTRPDAGKVQVLGGDPNAASTRARIGYLPERLQLPVAWTPLAFLHSVGRIKRIAGADREIERQLERVGLWPERQAKIGTFSKGMRQRLGLGAALLGAPELLVLDEPTDGIDPQGRAEVRAILAEERARGASIFLNSHLLAETERICDEVAFLVDGQVIRKGALLELCADPLRYRVRFAPGADARALLELGFVAATDPLSFECSGCDAVELNLRLERARATGALLVELSPAVRDLESLLLELLAAEAPRA